MLICAEQDVPVDELSERYMSTSLSVESVRVRLPRVGAWQQRAGDSGISFLVFVLERFWAFKERWWSPPPWRP